MKVAVVASTYPPYKGGMGNVAAAHAAAFRRTGHDVTVFAPGAGFKPLFRIGNAAVAPQLLWRLRGFDVVELHYPFFGGAEWVLLWKIFFGRGKRLTVVYHMDSVGHGALGVVFAVYRLLFLPAVLAAADRVVVTSHDYLDSSAARRVRSDKVRAVPLAVDPTRFTPSSRSTPEGHALFVGGLDRAHYFKGVGNLLEAFASVAKEFPSAGLTLVGDGDLRAEYEEKSRALGLADRVTFLGKISDADLPGVYRASSFLILPSVDRSEAFGLVTIEAAASGIPAIVSDLPGVRTTVVDGETGLRVPPGDVAALASALRRMFRDPAAVRAMGAKAEVRAGVRYVVNEIEKDLIAAVLL